MKEFRFYFRECKVEGGRFGNSDFNFRKGNLEEYYMNNIEVI